MRCGRKVMRLSNTRSDRSHRICSSRTNCQTKFFNKQVVERLRKREICVRPDIADTWMLHHDNAISH